MRLAIFFAGSGQDISSDIYVYKAWAEQLRSAGYSSILLSGVGIAANPGTNAITGKGWATIIQQAMTWVDKQLGGSQPEKFIVVGMSRGGVEALICAHCLGKQYPNKPVFVFAIDPVQGFHLTGKGSFDMSRTRSLGALFGVKGSRDHLKADYGLTNDAPRTIPANVEMYLTVLSQFRGSQRGLCWGFTPNVPLLNMQDFGKDKKVYELLGDHSSGVLTGLAQPLNVKTSREARCLVTTDMFYHWLKMKGFAVNIPQVDALEVLHAYCRIALDDLVGGVQFDDKRSGFSFLKASQNDPGRFNKTGGSRLLKGRGHLIASQQFGAASKGKANTSLGGYYVNERHFEVYLQLREPLKKQLAIFSSNRRFESIELWENYNANANGGFR